MHQNNLASLWIHFWDFSWRGVMRWVKVRVEIGDKVKGGVMLRVRAGVMERVGGCLDGIEFRFRKRFRRGCFDAS